MIIPWPLGYEKTKAKALGIYRRIGAIPAPAFNGELVFFTRIGFDHLTLAKGRKLRSKNEQKRRFRLLVYAEQILKNPKAIILYRGQEVKYKINRHGQEILLTGTGKFWTFTESIEGTRIKLVVGQIGDQKKQFISIMQ
jgi:hypothetical protein